MSDTALMTTGDTTIMERVVTGGDLSKMSPEERVRWYVMRCEAAGLDPRTQPFQYLNLQGKLVLYATKTATDQLCQIRGITTQITATQRLEDVYVVTCRASTAEGRYTEDIGAVNITGKRGDDLANCLMKAHTKSKRRAVLSLCGLGMLDESETETVPGARIVPVDHETGEVLAALPAPAQPAPAVESAGDRAAATGQRCSECKQAVEENVAAASTRHFGRVLCVPCGKMMQKSAKPEAEVAG